MEIRFLNIQDVVVYRELRLQALRDSPTAFGSSYEEESCFSLTDFAARLRPHDNSANGIFGAFSDTDKLYWYARFFTREPFEAFSHWFSLEYVCFA